MADWKTRQIKTLRERTIRRINDEIDDMLQNKSHAREYKFIAFMSDILSTSDSLDFISSQSDAEYQSFFHDIFESDMSLEDAKDLYNKARHNITTMLFALEDYFLDESKNPQIPTSEGSNSPQDTSRIPAEKTPEEGEGLEHHEQGFRPKGQTRH